uniref:Uncharacterized protein n=1 Tax=Panagrellus redivivus TaxID=6233 RepID=A0A7E4V1N4_PANRE
MNGADRKPLEATMSLKMSEAGGSYRHKPISRLFSTASRKTSEVHRKCSDVSRKSSVPSAVIFSAPLIGATVGDKFKEEVCEFVFGDFTIL